MRIVRIQRIATGFDPVHFQLIDGVGFEAFQQRQVGGRQAAQVPSYERPAILERLQGPPAPLVAPEEEL